MLEHFSRRSIPVRFLGGGSNVLIPEEGVAGAVLQTERLRRVFRDGERLRVWAGASLPGLVHDAAQAGLSGLEGFVGIPGTIGGAVRMNTGGRWGEIWDRIEKVELARPNGTSLTLGKDDAKPQYRNGGIGEMMCLAVVLRLSPARSEVVREQTKKVLQEKAAAQPLTERSAGCIFKNPPGESAGKLVERAGCKGWREGDIWVSEKHGNFFVNRGEGKARDLQKLIVRIQKEVQAKFEIVLEREIDLW